MIFTRQMIKALVKHSLQSKDVSIVEKAGPRLLPGEALVRTEACGICGSDVHAWRQDPGYEWVRAPVTLGHEAVGYVSAATYETDAAWIGKRVVPISIDGCGTCALCLSGQRQLCPERSVLGITFDGAAAQSFSIPTSRLVIVPESLPAIILALVEPLSVACHAIKLLGLTDEFTGLAVISGPGPIGILTALALKQRGIRVILTGASRDADYRLPLASSLGFDTVLVGKDALALHPDAWVEASGSGSALNDACASVLPGGVVVAVGLFAATFPLDMNKIVRNQVRLQGSYSSTRTDYETAVALLLESPTLWASLVTQFPLEQGVTALEKTAAAQVIKAVLTP